MCLKATSGAGNPGQVTNCATTGGYDTAGNCVLCASTYFPTSSSS